MMLSSMEHAEQAILNEGWIQHFQYVEEVDSTNALAKRWLRSESRDMRFHAPALFVAKRQTAGRGRSDHRWWSPEGCLMLTLVVGPELLPDDPELWGQLALLSGVSLAESAESFLPTDGQSPVRLKWPNDLFLGGKKCGGILIESAGRQNWLIGIGFNVHVDLSNAPAEVAQVATSLHVHAKRPLEPADALVELCTRLQNRLTSWKNDTNSWYAPWQDRCLLTGKSVTVGVPHSIDEDGKALPHQFNGFCEGVDTRGRLVVRTNAGLQIVSAGEVLSWI